MNINRNNYEEFFLLYADNELSKTERKVVEIFVQENPDLKEEFSMLKLTINSPDERVKLADKSFLMKKESASFINENNYEEIFVLYHDDELAEEQKTETDKFINQNPKYKNDFELIGKAKLASDISIVFPNKKQLYRKEKLGKIIPLILWRSLAAAVFIGFGLWIGFSYYNKNKVTQAVAVNTHNTINKPVTTDITTIPEKQDKEKKDIASTRKKTETRKVKKEEEKIKKPFLKVQKMKDNDIAKNNVKIKSPLTAKKIKKNQSEIEPEIVAATKPLKTVPVIEENTQIPLPGANAQHIDKIEPESQNTMHAQTVSYLADASTNNGNYVFYDIPAEEFRKSKIGGFLKKIRRVVERNNPITRLFAADEEQVAAK
ncbi:MAG TPA: hypothetical protein VIJ95_09935 [Hanamia sp.]